MNKAKTIALRLWWSGIVTMLLGLLWLSQPYAISAYYLERGSYSLERGAIEQGITDLMAALNLEPTNTLTSRRLAQAYLQSDQTDKALTVAQQAIVLAPDNPLVYLEAGDLYDRLGQVEQAIAAHEAGRVGDRWPHLTVNYFKLADKLWLEGDRGAAVSIWRDKLLNRSNYADLYVKWRLHQYYRDDT